MTSLLFGHLEDCSTPQYFCFSIRCEMCGEYWYSSSIPFSRFSQCPVCRRLVCDACFLICDEMDLCRECAARMKEPGEPVAP